MKPESDPLGEALAWWDDPERRGLGLIGWIPLQRIVAAARNWHALTNPSNELVERVAEAIYTKKWGPSMSGPKPGAMERDMAYSVIEAVRVTGENPQ